MLAQIGQVLPISLSTLRRYRHLISPAVVNFAYPRGQSQRWDCLPTLFKQGFRFQPFKTSPIGPFRRRPIISFNLRLESKGGISPPSAPV